jgi:O-antigen/teichoic acid export membrane protein
MVKKIIGTITTRIIIAMITLVTILINGWYLGAEKVGTISLIILAITLIQMLNNFIGGSALVYLTPRADLIKLFIPSYIWSFITSFSGALILELFHRIPQGFFWHVVVLSLILSLSSVNFMILMGQEKIRAYNFITLLQVMSLFIVLLFWLFILDQREVISYVIGLYVSYALSFVAGLAIVLTKVKWGSIKGTLTVLKEIFRYGSVMQTGNVLQFFNYRLSFYFIEIFMGRAAVGIYTVGVQLSESIWLVSRSIHMVQYARISNEKDMNYASRLTLNLTKISFIITLICLVILYLLLNLFFPLFFKPEFVAIKQIMVALSPGILTFSVSIILSPFFSGIGKPRYNTIAAAIGFIFTLVFGWILIPRYGFIGAGLSATISYFIATLYQFISFVRISRIRARDFLMTNSDISGIISGVKEHFSRTNGEN